MGKEKGFNAMDSFRKQQKKQDAKKNRAIKQQVNEVRQLLNDPSKIEEKIRELQAESDSNRLDKSLKDKIKEYKDMLQIAINKQKMNGTYAPPSQKDISSSSTAGPVAMNYPPPPPQQYPSHMGPPGGLNIPRRPDESIYYHPVHNPTATPPPGFQQSYRPLQIPRVTVSGGAGHRVPMGGMNGIPPPPQMNSNRYPPVGGMHGIPPPPPPQHQIPPTGGMYQVPPHAASMMSGMMRAVPPPPPVQSSAAAFVAMYGAPPPPPPPLPTDSISATVAIDTYPSAPHVLQQYPQPQEVTSPNESEEESVGTEEEAVEDYPTATAAAAVDPSSPPIVNFDDFFSAPLQLPNLADIMKRRFEVQETEEAIVEIPSPAVGPPLAESNDGQEDASNDINSVLNSVMAPPSSGLAALGDYGDDSDDEEELQQQFPTVAPGPLLTPAVIITAPAVQLTQVATDVPLPVISVVPTEPLPAPVPPSLLANGPPSQQQPKVIKANALLTKFVPAALKLKRPAPPTASQPAAKLSKLTPGPLPVTEPSKPSTGTAAVIDDAYNDFMAEINGLL